MSAFFDTLQSAKRFREVGFDEPAAGALTGLPRDVQQAERERLATKIERREVKIDHVAAELRAEFSLIRSR